jgi:hypothetical protein
MVSKQYTCDYVPLQKGKTHLFAKFDFKITKKDSRINLTVNCTDKYLLDFIRLKIVDKANLH